MLPNKIQNKGKRHLTADNFKNKHKITTTKNIKPQKHQRSHGKNYKLYYKHSFSDHQTVFTVNNTFYWILSEVIQQSSSYTFKVWTINIALPVFTVVRCTGSLLWPVM